jgi:hypothetical protein
MSATVRAMSYFLCDYHKVKRLCRSKETLLPRELLTPVFTVLAGQVHHRTYLIILAAGKGSESWLLDLPMSVAIAFSSEPLSQPPVA